jgi:2-(1,2-epoxy-1,2-dihydrophenyl)acetyl-CoA isomerase
MATSDDTDLLYELTPSGVAWITLNRPDAGNAITPQQRNDMAQLLTAASGDLNVRCVVITATGDRHFCTGADLRVSKLLTDGKPEGSPDRPTGVVARTIITGAQKMINAVLDCEKPVIGAINGTAAGIGAHLAFACDLVVASDNAKFIEVFVRRGITPDGGGAYLLTRLIGPMRAKELIFFGDDLPAARALELGLVNRVVPAGALRDEATAWAERIASSPTVALSYAKWCVNRAMDVDRRIAFGDEAIAQEAVMTSEDANEGVAAFIERRQPVYRGW